LAKVKVLAGEDIANVIFELNEKSVEIAKKVVYAGAEPVADEIRRSLEKNINDSSYVGNKKGNGEKRKRENSKGDLLDSLGIAKPTISANGDITSKVGFDGYDSKGVANKLKARVMESGTSTLKKRPFVRPSVNKAKGRSVEVMQLKYQEEIKKIKK